MKKLVLIGAGSAMFTRGLVMDLISERFEEDWELALVDVDSRVLDAAVRLTAKMLSEKNSRIRLSHSTDRRDVLGGADFVVTTIGVGGRRAWERDVFIPREFGVYQPVGDSVAPGGISRAMRMIPVMVDIARDVAELCPNAFFFNYANPMTTICTAVRQATGVGIVGLCHGVQNGLRRLARFAGVPSGELNGYVVGLNHFVVLYKLYRNGRNAWPEIMKALEAHDSNSPIGPLSAQFIKLYGAYPVSDDRHYSEFTQPYFGEGAYFGKTLGVDAFSFENTIAEGDKIYEETMALAQAEGPLPSEFWQRLEGEHEQLTRIIRSILLDRREVFNVNIPNGNSVPSLPSGAVLEMPAVASADGFRRLILDDFPNIFSGMLSKHSAIAQLTVTAALKGDRELFAEAIWQGGYLSRRDDAVKLSGRLIEAQKQYLPQF